MYDGRASMDWSPLYDYVPLKRRWCLLLSRVSGPMLAAVSSPPMSELFYLSCTNTSTP
jgi:hypothetical protein